MASNRQAAVADGGVEHAAVLERADRRRAEITQLAAELFDRKGYQSASMENIAEAAGVRKSTLYHYFSSKDEILYAIHDVFIDSLIAKQERRPATMPPEHVLREIMVDVLELMDTHKGHVRVFHEHARELTGEPYAAIARKREHYESMIREVFARGARDGSLREVDPSLATLALAGMCNYAYQWYRPGGRLSTRDIAYTFWDFFLHGISGAAAQGQRK